MDYKTNRRPRLLIVDDVELNRALLGEMFRSAYTVCEAENGRAALEVLEEQHDEIAAVLLDIVMPELDGFGVLKEMTERGWIGHIPVVMITAETSDSVMQRGYEMGAADIISKPFNPNMVRQRIRNVVEQYTYRQKLEALVEEQTRELRRQAQELRTNSIQLIDILSTLIEFKNTESVQHIYNIRILTKLILSELSQSDAPYGLNEEMIEAISEAAALHDIGKIAIPEQILNKPGKLTTEEFEVMKTHAARGCEILEKLAAMRRLSYYEYCYEICRHHHERWDGKGYPDGLAGDEIPISAQAVSLADVYDALISKRVYKDAYSSEEAVKMILDGECGVFNPVLMKCFLQAVPKIEEYAAREEGLSGVDQREVRPVWEPEKNEESDISARTLRLLEMERKKYQVLSEMSEEILFDYDVEKDRITFSEKYQIQTGQDLEINHLLEHLRRGELMEQEYFCGFLKKLADVSPEHPGFRIQLRLNLDGKGFQWYEVYIYSIWDMSDEPVCVSYIGKLINIEVNKQERLRLELEANSDPLTGLLNRKAMEREITGLLEGRQVERGALCFLDVDNLKKANDSFGHAFGDRLLCSVASVLAGSARKTDLIGRIGGDEFLMFFRDIDRANLEKKMVSIREQLVRNLKDFRISASVGIALYPDAADTYGSLLCKADEALYFAKQQGKDRFQVYGEV